PNHPVVDHTLHADCPSLLFISPQTIDFGYVVVGSDPKMQVTIKRGNHPQSPELGSLKIASTGKDVKIQQDRITPDALTLIVSLRSTAPKGRIGSDINIRCQGKIEPIRIPVSAEVSGPFVVAPETLFLREIVKGDSRDFGTVVIRRIDGKPVGPIVK